MADRITWEHGRYGSLTGRVGHFTLFTIHTSTRRGDPKPYLLDTELPTRISSDGFASADEAKASAEKFIDSWVHLLGATWNDEET